MPREETKGAVPTSGSVQQITKYLDQEARSQQFPGQLPKRYIRLSAVDLYEQFLKVRPEAKGMITSGYGSVGWAGGISAGIDVGAFILPGLLHIPLEGSATLQVTSSAILVIHHSMPRILPPIEAICGNTAVWASSRSVCFMGLYGKSSKGTIAGSAGVFFIQEMPEIPTGEPEEPAPEMPVEFSLTEIPLLLSIGGEISGSYAYERLYAREPNPGWYCCVSEEGLKMDFLASILTPKKLKIKQEIQDWINDFNNKIYPLSTRALTLLHGNPSQLHNDFIAVQQAMLDKRRKKADSVFGKLLTTVQAQVKKSWETSFPKTKRFYDNIGNIVGKLEAAGKTTEGLLNIIANLRDLIPMPQEINNYYPASVGLSAADQQDKAAISRALEGLRRQLDAFEDRLNKVKVAEGFGLLPNQIPPKPYGSQPARHPADPYHCFLKISSHSGEAGAGLAGKVLVAGAGAGINGHLKKTAYRYQTFSRGSRFRSALICTQDTSITYRQVQIGAHAKIAVLGKEPSQDLIANGMTYRSACAYWLYPSSDAHSEAWVPLQAGSGISFGASVNTADLTKLISAFKQSRGGPVKLSKGNQRTIRKLASYLRVTGNTLKGFLSRIQNLDLGAHPAILLEANFAFPMDFQHMVTKQMKKIESGGLVPIYRLKSLWEKKIPAPPHGKSNMATFSNVSNKPTSLTQYLSTIRIRARMADFRESETPFKLGVSEPTSGADIGITLTKIEKAGQEGILELYQENYGSLLEELRVPPVALFHQ